MSAKERESEMTPRQRILALLRGERADRVPFTWKMPYDKRGVIERELRDDGMALIWRCEVVTIQHPNVEVIRHEYREDSRPYLRETFHTPVGDISQVWAVGGGYGSRTLRKHLIETEQDYETAEFIVRDEVYTSNDPAYRRADEVIGEDGFVFGGWMPPSPIMVMLWNWLGPMQFAIDSVERADRFERLYQLFLERQVEQYRVAAESSALVIHVDENMTADMIGVDRFERYCMPAYQAFADAIHPAGKLLAVHMDGKLAAIRDQIGRSAVDIVEAFTPVPDTDLTLADARKAWGDKIVWMNFPSSVHLRSADEIEAMTKRLLAEAAPGNRFLLGITEDVPEGAWDVSMPAIHRIVKQDGALPISLP
jgi:hypothetical protein